MRLPVRTDDPLNSHVAERASAPARGSKREAVLAYLQGRKGDWVDAPELATPEVGGFAGTRRLRELRDMGWDIETRQKPGSATVWQHRLAPSVTSLPPSRRPKGTRADPQPTSRQSLSAADGKKADRAAAAKQRGRASSKTGTSASAERLAARVAEHDRRKAEAAQGGG